MSVVATSSALPRTRFLSPLRSWPKMEARNNIRGVVHSVTESGVARLVFEDDYRSFKGMLLNQAEESVSVSGVAAEPIDLENVFASTSKMNVTVVDGDTGDKYCITDVPMKFVPKVQEITGVAHQYVEIDHPSIRFRTKDLLIGNRADVEIGQFIDPNMTNCTASNRKAQLHVGPMYLRLVTVEKTIPSDRRMSSCSTCDTTVIEQSNDFFV